MQTSFRVFINTIALYIKMFFTTLISLYLTRVVLNVLGVEDFGIYNLIAGVIAILSFLNSSLMSSSQRFFSVAMGKGDLNLLKTYFSSSLLIHIGFILLLVCLLELCYPFIFDLLTISEDRLSVARSVYQIMVFSMVVTIIGVPFNAAINANEDLYFFALVEVITAFLKLIVIFLFDRIVSDNLLIYTMWMFITTLLNILIKYVWCKYKYNECQNIHLFKIDNNVIKQLLSFSGWNALGAFAMVGRNQGVAVVLNVFFGTAINAVYGIANQVNGQLIYFSQMLTASTAPQIMKSAGEGNNAKMLSISIFTSKIAFFLSAVLAIPLLVELPYVLTLWLKDVPEYTKEFCGLLMFVFLIMQLYPGLTRAIQAEGNVKLYQILLSVFLLLPILFAPLLFYFNYPSYSICILMIIAQFFTLLLTVFISRKNNNLDAISFLFYVLKALVLFVITLIIIFYLDSVLSSTFNLIGIYGLGIVVLASVLLFSSLYFLFVFDKSEKSMMCNLLKTLIRK